MIEVSCKDDNDGYQANVQRCTKCSTFKSENLKSRRHQRFFTRRGMSPRSWHFLLALSSWHSMSVFLLLALLTSWKGIGAQKPPPNYAHGNMPETNFTCDHKTTGGYYADPEAGCQMFHVCVKISEEEINDYKFLCPNNTVFDQKNFICTNWWEIDCEMSTKYYNKNDLFKPTEATTHSEVDYIDNPETVYVEYVYEYEDPEPASHSTDTTSAQGRHRLNLGKSTREEKAISVKEESPANSQNSPPFVSSSVSVSKPRTTFSTSSIKRTSIDFSEPVFTQSQVSRRTSPTTASTTPATTTATSTTTVTARPTFTTTSTPRPPAATSPGAPHNPFQKGVIGQSVVEPALSSDSDDPFANYDWKKDSRDVAPRSRGGRQGVDGVTADETIKKRPRPDQQARKARRRNNPAKKADNTNPKAKLKEFSNFRFYKTAFGVSYSSDDYFSTTEGIQEATTEEPRLLAGRSRTPAEGGVDQKPSRALEPSPNRGHRRFRNTDDQTAKGARLRSLLRRRAIQQRRKERVASRTTRYSKYGR